MFFQKKIDRAFDELKKKSGKYDEKGNLIHTEQEETEKGDFAAMFLAASKVFGPIFIVLIIILILTRPR